MISAMNPSPNLFDETFFALKFTGVASQVVVNSEDQRNKFHDSLKRLTQLWMQSSQRWSNFAHLQPPKPSVSIIQTIKEEDECEGDEGNDLLEMTVEDLEKRVNEITHMDLSKADPQEIDMLRTQIDFLVEKLKQTENDKIEMEMEVRQQVVSEFNKMIADMEEMAENKDKAKKKLEEMMTQRLINNENIHKQEKLELEHKINALETENFRITEQLCLLREEKASIERELNIEKQKWESKIKELESRIELSDKTYEDKKNGSFRSVCTSPILQTFKDANTSVSISVSNANTSAINFNEYKDINTSAINFIDDSVKIETSDEGVGTSMIFTNDCETSTSNLNQFADHMTNTSQHIQCSDKSTCVNNTSLIEYQDKQTETKWLSPAAAEDKPESSSPNIVNEVDETILCPSAEQTKEHLVSKQEYLALLEQFKKLEDSVKEKDGIIKFNQIVTIERDAKLKTLEDENKKLNEKLNSDFGLQHILKSSKSGSIAGSSVTSKSVTSEDTNSIASFDSINDIKPKKSAKYSSRKRKPNADTSLDKRYLSSINDMEVSR